MNENDFYDELKKYALDNGNYKKWRKEHTKVFGKLFADAFSESEEAQICFTAALINISQRTFEQAMPKLDMLEGILHMVVAANDVRDALVDVIHHVRQMENGGAVAADDGEILDILGLLRHMPLHDVVEFNGAFLRHAKHHDFTGLAVTGRAFALVRLSLGKKPVHALKMALDVLRLVELGLVVI